VNERRLEPGETDKMGDLREHASHGLQNRPVAMVSPISAYFPNTSVRYSGEIETARAAIRAQYLPTPFSV
jgi:hypothetical protein